MIKAIIFDFFGVIVTDGMGQYFNKYLMDANKRAEANKLFDMRSRGVAKFSDESFFEMIAQLGGTSKEVVTSSIGSKPNVALLEYIRKDIKPKYKIGLLSNASDNWFEMLLDVEDAKLFDAVLLSYQHKMIKPQSRFYILVSQELGVKPQECVFVDDIKRFCDGAENVGMKSIQFKNLEQFKQDIQSLLANANY